MRFPRLAVIGANRLLAVAFAAVWLLPAYKLVHLPNERATVFLSAVAEQLKSTDGDIPALKLRPYYAPSAPLSRDDATRMLGDPEFVETMVTFAWALEVIAFAVVVCGVACLWWKPYLWRAGVIAGVLAFAFLARFFVATWSLVKTGVNSWFNGDSVGAYLTVQFPGFTPSTVVTFFISPIVLAVVTLYVITFRERRESELDSVPS